MWTWRGIPKVSLSPRGAPSREPAGSPSTSSQSRKLCSMTARRGFPPGCPQRAFGVRDILREVRFGRHLVFRVICRRRFWALRLESQLGFGGAGRLNGIQSGPLSCLRPRSSSRRLARSAMASWTTLRVSAGSMTASTYPLSAAIHGVR